MKTTKKDLSRNDQAERILRAILDQNGFRIIGVPEGAPSIQEPGAVVLRLDIRIPASIIDAEGVVS